MGVLFRVLQFLHSSFQVDGKIGSFLMLADGVARILASVLVGSLIASEPRVLLYLQVISTWYTCGGVLELIK